MFVCMSRATAPASPDINALLRSGFPAHLLQVLQTGVVQACQGNKRLSVHWLANFLWSLATVHGCEASLENGLVVGQQVLEEGFSEAGGARQSYRAMRHQSLLEVGATLAASGWQPAPW